MVDAFDKNKAPYKANEFNNSESLIQDNNNPSCKADDIASLVSRVETLHDLINQEFSSQSEDGGAFDDHQVEIWSQEIDILCKKIESLSVTNMDELRAKVSLNLSMISKSFSDSCSIEMHSQRIMDALDDFNAVTHNRILRVIR